MINFDVFRLRVPPDAPPSSKSYAQIQAPPWDQNTHPDLTGSPLAIVLNDEFEANSSSDPSKGGDELLLAVTPHSSSVNVTIENELNVHRSALDFFPEQNGAIRLVDVLSEEGYHDVFFEKIVEENDYAKLSGLNGVPTNFELKPDDFVILSPYNYIIESNGRVSGTGTSGAQNLTMNYTDPEPPDPRPLSSSSDISGDDFPSPDLAMPKSAPGTVSVVTIDQNGETKKGVQLGGDVGSASSAAWYGGDVSIGGFDVCTDGKCNFNNGVRVFFIFDYNGTGDGFTFALASGSNELNSYGFRGEYMGYAGVSSSGTQISQPKLALEFDTYTNSARNDPGDSNKDYLQYVYWGGSAADVWDDNTHDTGGFGPKWPPYLPPFYADGEIRTKPLLNSAETRLYFTSNNGYLHELNPETGTPNAGTNFPRWLEDTAEASPALDSRGYIYNPGDNNYLNVFTPTGSWAWWDYVYADAKSSPVIDSNDVVYFGDNEGDFYAYEVTCGGSCSWSRKWRYPIGDKDIKCTPDLSPDEKTVYFVSTQANYLYAVDTADGTLNWQFDLYGISNSSPTVADDGTIYIGGDGGSGVGYLFAVNPDGSQKWRYDFYPTNPHSRPALGPDGTIYIGNDDDYLYAITDDETQGTLTWRFLTGGNVRGGPTVHDDGTIWFGSDDNYLYAVDSNGLLIDKFQTGADVQSSPTQGADGTIYVGSNDYRLYALKGSCNPQNIKSRYYTSDNLPGDVSVSSNNDWLNSGPWAARMEITRSTTVNSRNKYEYTLKMWLRQCKDQACIQDTADRTVVGSYFEDTRIAYEAREPYLEQTIELCEADHLAFDTFIFGYTQGTGGAVQRITITDSQLAFIRPGDFVVTEDDNWPEQP
ncbi:MAG: PQQ-binding-like beta-propeller repeat protein [Desulfobacterales bacterium]|nr:PQQ-binding-like beta-propeller repeat protein [Desulfobacterales bacterium]